MLKDTPSDVLAEIVIRYRDSGALSVSGNIGDKTMALKLIDHAREAIQRQVADPNEIVIPNKDVAVVQNPNFPTVPKGDYRK